MEFKRDFRFSQLGFEICEVLTQFIFELKIKEKYLHRLLDVLQRK